MIPQIGYIYRADALRFASFGTFPGKFEKLCLFVAETDFQRHAFIVVMDHLMYGDISGTNSFLKADEFHFT